MDRLRHLQAILLVVVLLGCVAGEAVADEKNPRPPLMQVELPSPLPKSPSNETSPPAAAAAAAGGSGNNSALVLIGPLNSTESVGRLPPRETGDVKSRDPPSPSASPPPPPLNDSLSSPSPPVAKLNPKTDQNPVGDAEPVKPIPTVSTRSSTSNEALKCDSAVVTKCLDGRLLACLRHPDNDPKKLFIIVKNEGQNPLNVVVIIPPNEINSTKLLPHNSSDKFEITSTDVDNLGIVLKVGTSKCVISASRSRAYLPQSPIYAIRLTPINGLYACFLAAVLAGCTWACCRFGRKGKRVDDNGVPYQELEMGVQTQPTSSIDMEAAAHGWDQWDEDWDDDESSTSKPLHKLNGNELPMSSSSTKDGWEDWDD